MSLLLNIIMKAAVLLSITTLSYAQRYWLSPDRKTFKEAFEVCQEKGKDLATPFSRDENARIRAFISTEEWVYIGLTDRHSEGNWTTLNGAALSYQNWDPASDLPFTANCATMHSTNSTWFEVDCNAEHRFLCG